MCLFLIQKTINVVVCQIYDIMVLPSVNVIQCHLENDHGTVAD